jgi:hypothetical protein
MSSQPIFGNAALQRAITRATANLDSDDQAALVAHVDDEEGASLSLVIRVNDEWKLQGTVVKKWNEPFRYGAEVVWHGKFFG